MNLRAKQFSFSLISGTAFTWHRGYHFYWSYRSKRSRFL